MLACDSEAQIAMGEGDCVGAQCVGAQVNLYICGPRGGLEQGAEGWDDTLRGPDQAVLAVASIFEEQQMALLAYPGEDSTRQPFPP